jgi:transposase
MALKRTDGDCAGLQIPVLRPGGSMSSFLFDKGDAPHPSPEEAAAEFEAHEVAAGTPRLRVPQRDQVEMHWASLDQLLEADHPARVVWAAVCGLNLSRWLQQIKAVEGHVGRNATDPRLLLALWVNATLDGVGSARGLARLCQKHLAYQWLCGGVSVNYHMLADFRSQHSAAWDELLTQIVGSLMAEGLVTLNRVAQDGMRVRASAGKSSFRRETTLEKCLAEAREQVAALKKLAEENPEAMSRRQRATRERAAKERAERIEEAVRQCEQLQQEREASAKKSGRQAKAARASTTDPEARVMQFSDGGFRPGYNVQFSTDVDSGIIAGVETVNAGNDSEQLPPMNEQLRTRYGVTPPEALVDGGFASLDAIEECEQSGCQVYAPLKDEEKQREAGKNPHAPKKGDGPGVAAWRERMGTAAAKAIYRMRCQTAEWVNANCRNHGLWQMPVRGDPKVRMIALLHAITHNLLQGVKLRAEAAAASG